MAGNCSSEIGIGDRWAALLRDQVYRGPDKAKRIQKDWGISLSMAYVWLGGGKPTTDQIERARELWGDVVITFLFGRRPLMSVDERLSAVEQRIADLKSGRENRVEDHRRIDDVVSNLAVGSSHAASRGQRSQGALVGARQRAVNHWRLWRALKAEADRRGECPQ